MTQLTLLPQYGTFNGGDGFKAICQPSYVLNTATTDVFLFQKGEVQADGLLSDSGQPHDEAGGGHLNHS
jgi:hypothetical protein